MDCRSNHSNYPCVIPCYLVPYKGITRGQDAVLIPSLALKTLPIRPLFPRFRCARERQIPPFRWRFCAKGATYTLTGPICVSPEVGSFSPLKTRESAYSPRRRQ